MGYAPYYSLLFYLLCGENDLQGGRRGQVGAKQRSKAQVEALRLPFWIRLCHKSIAAISLMTIIFGIYIELRGINASICVHYTSTYAYLLDCCTSFTELFFLILVGMSFALLAQFPSVGCLACRCTFPVILIKVWFEGSKRVQLFPLGFSGMLESF